MIHDLNSLESYFATFKGTLSIADFVFGNTNDILNRQSATIRYPCLWLELLEERLDEDDKTHFDIRLTLQNIAGSKPRELDRDALNNLRKTLRKVIKKLQKDSPRLLVMPKQTFRFYYKEAFAGDNELYAQVEMQVGAINICEED